MVLMDVRKDALNAAETMQGPGAQQTYALTCALVYVGDQLAEVVRKLDVIDSSIAHGLADLENRLRR